MSEPKLIQGNIHTDERGILKYMNDLDLTPIKRFYCIQNKSNHIIRAWQAHKMESKWFYVIQGSFKIGVVKIYDFENPSKQSSPSYFELSAENHQILYVPGGFANGFKSLSTGAVLMVFSDKLLADSMTDDFRYDVNTWEL
jgi:dTDP-4-dehydrorhamnose 3,5-epimerase-like enzyme